MENNRFKVVLVGIIFDPKKRKLLIGKNIGDKNFSFLEGDLRFDEELDKELKRITFEKTGYKVHNLGAIYANNCIENCRDKLELYFLCEATEGKEKPGKNVQELTWVKPSEVEKNLGIKLPSRLHEYIVGLG